MHEASGGGCEAVGRSAVPIRSYSRREFENEPAQKRKVDEPRAIIVAVHERTCEARPVGKEPAQSLVADNAEEEFRNHRMSCRC